MDTRFPITWTTKEVKATLIDAGWHCLATGGRALPYLKEPGVWDTTSTPDDDEDERRKRRRRSPRRISFLEKAIWWPVTYLHDEPERARMLQIWLACKMFRVSFGEAVEEQGVSRATAYRMVERASTLISVGLDRDGVPLWGE